MKTRIIFALAFLFSLMTAFACDDGGGNNKKDMTPEEYMDYISEHYVTNYCDYMARCPEAGSEMPFSNVNECRTLLSEFLMVEVNEEMMWGMENGAEPNPSKLDECMDALKNSDCDVNLDAIPACRQIFTGTVANGQPCSLSAQCASGYCDLSNACPGTCAPTKASGEECSSNEECDLGLICTDSDTCGQPPAKKNQGDACEYDDECKYGLYCLINDFQNNTGTCQPWLGEGDDCENDQTEMVCGPGLACSSETGTCQTVTVVGEGQACDETHECNISQRLVCGPQETCIKLPAEGEACFYGYCWTGYICGEDDVCHATKEIGEACTAHDECTTGQCDMQNHVCTYDPCFQGEIDY